MMQWTINKDSLMNKKNVTVDFYLVKTQYMQEGGRFRFLWKLWEAP